MMLHFRMLKWKRFTLLNEICVWVMYPHYWGLTIYLLNPTISKLLHAFSERNTLELGKPANNLL